MNFILLTQYDGKIVGPIAKLLGVLMDGLFKMLSGIGIPNIGLAIFLFTIVVNIILLPLTINQQKNMKLNQALAPELSRIQAKYKGKRDQASLEKQQRETQMLQEKYGYNPTSGCLPLLIQMPILFALYRVIYQIPGYVTAIKDQFQIIAEAALKQDGFVTKIADLASSNMVTDATNFDGSTVESVNHIIDLLYKFDSSEWAQFKSLFPNIADTITEPLARINEYNSFLFGIQLNEAPGYKLTIALIIPFLAWFTQWLSMKVTSGAQPTNPDDPTAQAMKSMNTFMPLFSAFICITLPAGLGVYWVASAVVRTVIQVFINKRFEKISNEDIIAESVAEEYAAYGITSDPNSLYETTTMIQRGDMLEKEKKELVNS